MEKVKLDTSLKNFLTENGYFNLKIVENKVCGFSMYFSTVGLLVGLSHTGYERRYCYQNLLDAARALDCYNSAKTHPMGNWIKCKGVFEGKPIDLFNPEWKDDQGKGYVDT